MHVCHIWERFWPLEIGGLERYILWLSNYLHRNQTVDFSLITGRTKILWITKNIKKVEDAGFLKVYRLGPSPVDLVNGALTYFIGSKPKIVDRMKFASLCSEAAKWEAAKSADVFHIHGIWSDLEYINLGIYLSARFQKPLVVTLHGVIGNPIYGGMPLESPVIKKILQDYATAITTYSKDVQSVLEKIGVGQKTFLVPNFVDARKFVKPNSSTQHDITIIYVGRLEALQTPKVVIQAFKHVTEQFPNAKLLMIGYGSLYEQMKTLVKELNLEENVSLLGKQTDVRSYLWKSDIFVATNFGYIASLEAWCAGLAVVAPSFGILKEVISHENNGLLVAEHDAEQYAAAIMRLIKDKQLRERLATNGFRTAQIYDIKQVASKMADVYRSVIESNM